MGITVKLRFRAAEGREGTLAFLLGCGRASVQCSANYKILHREWNSRRRAIAVPPPGDARREAVMRIRRRVRYEMAALTRMANRMTEADEGVSLADVAEQWREFVAQLPFFGFMQGVIDGLAAAGKEGTARKYRSAMRSFERFNGGRDLMLYEVDAELVEAYERWLAAAGVCMNTASFYMRILRAVVNRAVRQGLVAQTHPFERVYTGVAETRKRAVDLDALRRIKGADLGGDARLEFARDLFLLSFYCRGMAFVDIAYLRKSDLADGYLCYTRRKTGQRLVVKWEPQMQAIVDKYAAPGPYLLPIITDVNAPAYQQYVRMNKSVCRSLKTVAKRSGLTVPLTMYVARHSWTSIAHRRNHPLAVISRALGHTSERTTQIYLAALDTASIDAANADLLSALT
mgnify:FL=1